MEQKISLFDDFDGGETVGLNTIEENLNSQLEGLTDWRDNMAQLAGQVGGNMSAELYNHLVELGPDAANIVQEMVNSLDPETGDGGEKLREIAERYAEVLDIKEQTAENMADVSFIIQSALSEISESSPFDFENLLESLDEAKETVTEKGGAISEGLEESFTETVETLRQCGAQIPEGLAESLANGEITIEDAIGKMRGEHRGAVYLSFVARPESRYSDSRRDKGRNRTGRRSGGTGDERAAGASGRHAGGRKRRGKRERPEKRGSGGRRNGAGNGKCIRQGIPGGSKHCKECCRSYQRI